MSDLRIEGVPCFEHQVVQDEVMPEVPAGFPFSKRLLDELVASCPVVVEFPADDDESAHRYGPFNTTGRLDGSDIGLRRITAHHGRSYELFFGDSEKIPQLIWGDGKTNEFTSLSIKGNNFTNPHVFTSLTAPSGYIPYGLLETDAFKRVMRASRIMRENEIDTEMIVKVLEPQYLRYNKLDPETGISIEDEYEYVTQPEFRRRLLADHWKKIVDQPDAEDEFKKVSKAINAMSYFFTVRAMGVGTRLLDFVVNDKGLFLREVDKVFAYLNARHDLPDTDTGDKPQRFSIHDDEHVRHYLYQQLPEWIGSNMGKMHRLGLAHTFPVLGNINAHGELVDLDSVKGEPLGLGDKPVTEEDFQRDIDQATGVEYDTADDHARFFILTENHTGRTFDDAGLSNQQTFKAFLLKEYVLMRFAIPESRDINELDEVRFLQDLPRIDALLEKAVGRNSLFVDGLLKSAFGTDVFPVVLNEPEEAAAALEYRAWVEQELVDYLTGRAILFLSRKRLVDMHFANGSWFFNQEANSFLHTIGKQYCAEHFVDPILSQPEAADMLRGWISAYKKPDCKWSDEGLYALLESRMRYEALLNITQKVVHAGLGPAGRFSLTLTSTIDQDAFGVVSEFEPLKAVADGQLFIIWHQIDLDILLANLADEVNGEPLQVIYEGGAQAGGIRISVPEDFRLAEIITDGKVKEVGIDNHDKECVGRSTVTIPSDGSHGYFAYALENDDSGEVTLYIVQ